ncbi:hypothetical protein GGI12_001740 [Dipsacomyces acuminosporus]|nr:hypothetical protein GGI12_001740 [Dipsacomyces acuminosporus]
MQTEIESTANFWLKYIPDTSLSTEKKECFKQALIDTLTDKYTGHWHLEKTTAGSGYRSISNWKCIDSSLASAASQADVSIEVLERHLPRDIVLWCDPYNVTYRVGDHGSIYTVYEDKRGLIESVKKNMAEKVSKSNGDFVISAYTTPVVIRTADGVEIARRGGNGNAQQGSPTKGAADIRRANAMSPLRQSTTFRDSSLAGANAASLLGGGSDSNSNSIGNALAASASPPSLGNPHWPSPPPS